MKFHPILKGTINELKIQSYLSVASDIPNKHIVALKASLYRASLVAQTVKRLPAMWETWVRFLGREDPLEKAMAPTPVFLPGKSHGLRSLMGCSPWGR